MSGHTGEGKAGSKAKGEVADLSYQIAAEPEADDARKPVLTFVLSLEYVLRCRARSAPRQMCWPIFFRALMSAHDIASLFISWCLTAEATKESRTRALNSNWRGSTP